MNRAARRQTAKLIAAGGTEGKAMGAMVDLYDLIKEATEHMPPEFGQKLLAKADQVLKRHGLELKQVAQSQTIGIA